MLEHVVRACAALLVMMACAATMFAGNKQDKQEEGVNLLRRAVELTDISEQPYRFRYTVKVSDPVLGNAQGTRLVTHASPQKFRDEVHFPLYTEVRVFRDGQLYRARTLPFTPMAIREYGTRALRRLQSDLKDYKVSKVFDRKIQGVQARCVERKREHSNVLVNSFCVFPDSGLPAAIIGGGDNTEFSDYVPFAGHQVARVIRSSTPRTKIELRLEEFGTDVPADDGPFLPPNGAAAQPWCEDMTPAQALATPDPNYPSQARQKGLQGAIVYEVGIGADGMIKRVVPIATDASFDPNARKALQDWRFKPATCSGVAVPSEIVVEINFRLY